MQIVSTIGELQQHLAALRSGSVRVALVPTMGYLHEGHLALVRRARELAEVVVATIFVNPTQFAPNEDYERYPRDADGDARKLSETGCDLLFHPDVEQMYPAGFGTTVRVEGVALRYEGAVRPGHFDGVATVVAKLFNIVRPEVAIFGQKDAQQVAVIRQLVRDLNMPVAIDVVETLREDDGLARSSRNVYLSEDDRREAVSISRGLFAARDAIRRGEGVGEAERRLRAALSSKIAIDYADIIDADTFEHANGRHERRLLAVVAGRIGRTRLIDNLPLDR